MNLVIFYQQKNSMFIVMNIQLDSVKLFMSIKNMKLIFV